MDMRLPAKSTKKCDASLNPRMNENGDRHAPLVILVVEDDDAVRRLVDVALRTFEFAVIVAASGKKAIEILRQHNIDLVLLDVQMPVMDGPSTLAALREIDPNLICCFMSGHTGKYTAEDLLHMGAAKVIEKPFRLHHLRQTILDAVDQGAR